MALPTKQKTWTYSANNRVAFATVLAGFRTMLFDMKTWLKTIPGVTVIGSSNSTTAALDATDRWVTSANLVRGSSDASPQAWIILRFSNIGATFDFLITFNKNADYDVGLYFSPGGLYVLAGTVTHKPTATDEVTLTSSAGSTFDANVASVDRLWTGIYASDGKNFDLLVARSGAWSRWVKVGEVNSTVLSPGAHSPNAVGWNLDAAGGFTTLTTAMSSGTALARARVNGGSGYVNVNAFLSAEGSGSQPVNVAIPQTCQLNGGGYSLSPLGAWTLSDATARGKIGNFVDAWAGLTSAADGDTYPNDATRLFVQIGDLVAPWDGSIPVLT